MYGQLRVGCHWVEVRENRVDRVVPRTSSVAARWASALGKLRCIGWLGPARGMTGVKCSSGVELVKRSVDLSECEWWMCEDVGNLIGTEGRPRAGGRLANLPTGAAYWGGPIGACAAAWLGSEGVVGCAPVGVVEAGSSGIVGKG